MLGKYGEHFPPSIPFKILQPRRGNPPKVPPSLLEILKIVSTELFHVLFKLHPIIQDIPRMGSVGFHEDILFSEVTLHDPVEIFLISGCSSNKTTLV